ncbi:transmembrane protein 130 [Parasteatoda tepidariorum]|nr:transmembrane protein 130 [Parasteatoda tepidariorum]
MKSILLFYLSITICLKFTGGASTAVLLVTNNGPSYLGANVTFSAVLLDYSSDKTLTFVFDDGIIDPEEHQTKDHNVTISRAFPESIYDEGTYDMNVTVLYTFLWERTLVSNLTNFQLQKDLIGEIVVQHGDDYTALDLDEVAVGSNVSFAVNIYNPGNYLNDAVFSYGWSVDWERHQTSDNLLIYKFKDRGLKDIKSIVTAALPNNVFLSGSFDKIVNAKVPVDNLNVTGNFFMHHGETLNLNINCSGTPPFIYCYKLMNGNDTSDNFTCSHVSTFTTCHMEIIKYLQKDGKYNLGIYVSNNVREIKKVYEVMVYSVSVTPTLSTVIMPIVCSLLALIIICGGIAYFIQHKNQMEVETANFDFQDESDLYPEQTFFEKLFDSLSCRNCKSPQLSCSSASENDPLI